MNIREYSDGRRMPHLNITLWRPYTSKYTGQTWLSKRNLRANAVARR